MTVLSLIQTVCDKLGEKRPTSLVGSSNTGNRQWIALLNDVGQDLVERASWPELEKDWPVTLVASQSTYALPDDFDRHQFDSNWDRTNQWPLIGPVNNSDWRQLQDGVTSTGPRAKFRITGMSDSQIEVSPTPDASSAGDIYGFPYLSTRWLRPMTWAASTAFAAGSYCFYDGNVYYTSAGGTTGATAPTHTSGSASDDSVSWAYSEVAYNSVVADTDVPVLSEKLLIKGVEVLWLMQNGLDYQRQERDYEMALSRAVTKLRGKRKLSYRGNPTFQFRLLSSENIQNTGFGS